LGRVLVGRLAAVATALTIAACGSAPAPPSRTPSPGTAAATPSAAAVVAGSASAGGVPGKAVARSELLRMVDASAAGLTLAFDGETTATELADPQLDADVAGLATGIATPTGQADPAELVIVNVVELRTATLDDTWFRDWRDSYDRAACQPAGGVAGHAESKIASRDVFITRCAGGAFTYHTRPAPGRIVVSMTSIGPTRLGERLMAHLAP
jgi:hypothetical protein